MFKNFYLDISDEDFLVSAGQDVSSALVGAEADGGHGLHSSEATTHAIVDTLRLTPARAHAVIPKNMCFSELFFKKKKISLLPFQVIERALYKKCQRKKFSVQLIISTFQVISFSDFKQLFFNDYKKLDFSKSFQKFYSQPVGLMALELGDLLLDDSHFRSSDVHHLYPELGINQIVEARKDIL